jgi:nucleoside-diphosphate-sugar epimerase
MDWKGRKILVTGGAGLIGSALVENLVERGVRVTVADNLWRGKKENLMKEGYPVIDFDRDFHQVDLVEYANCLRVAQGQEVIYHLADVVAGINYVFGNQLSLFHTNVVMNSNMLHAAIEAGVKKYVYVGTACSYPAEKQSVLNPPPFKEEDAYPASPESSYGWSKLMGEYECELAEQEGLIEVGILRLHNVYGPKSEMSPEKSQVIPALIRKAINYPKEEFVVWGSGNQRRAFVYIDDVISALFSVVEHGMGKGVIQIGPHYSMSIREIAETIVSISGKDIDIHYDPTKREGDMDRVADWEKAKQILGWSPETSIETGLKKTYEWCSRYLGKNSIRK